jgi:7-keto-8-aminopelargonate synthetase-like enzyme
MLTADDVTYFGRQVSLRGRNLLNFGSCSYLGLEQRRELKEAAVRATLNYGTQFSFSRAYLQSPLYDQLEDRLACMTDGYPLVAPSTTLGHIAALPVLVKPGDAVVVDQFAHASLQTAVGLLRSHSVELVRHSRLELLDRKVARLARQHRIVWYILDGMYSMSGDLAPMADLAQLLAKYDCLHLYVDDAHSTSWYGKHGRGLTLQALADRRRVVVALSLNKAFSAGGGALIFPNPEDRARVRRCGGPMLFSGPIPPPMLGAALASAQLHLEPQFAQLQTELLARVNLVHHLAQIHDVPLATTDRTPVFFVKCGFVDRAIELAQALHSRGFYVCPSVFPAVPLNQSGIRFTVSLHNTEEDIRLLLEALAEVLAVSRKEESAIVPAADLEEAPLEMVATLD